MDQLARRPRPAPGPARTYKYDNEGNQTEQGADRFEYNLDHTLLSATVGGQKSTYAYNADGNG